MGWKPRGILSPKTVFSSNPLIFGLVSPNCSKIFGKELFHLLHSILSIPVFLSLFYHNFITVDKYLNFYGGAYENQCK